MASELALYRHDGGMSWSEALGFATGAVSVWLYVRQNVWAWPTGIANGLFWLVLFWGSRLYLNAGLQVVYVVLSVWGWYWWLRGGRRGAERLPVSGTPRVEAWLLAAVGVGGTLVLSWAMVAVDDALPLPDAVTTVVSLIAQYMLTRKLLANGRAYCEEQAASGIASDWRTEEFAHIARRQLADEDAAARLGGRLLICDTDALATSVWHDRYLGTPSAEVRAMAAGRRYALYVLTSDDIPFVQDGTRDGEHIRGWMTGRFREVLRERTEPWLEVRGGRAERLAVATSRIEALLAAPVSR